MTMGIEPIKVLHNNHNNNCIPSVTYLDVGVEDVDESDVVSLLHGKLSLLLVLASHRQPHVLAHNTSSYTEAVN